MHRNRLITDKMETARTMSASELEKQRDAMAVRLEEIAIPNYVAEKDKKTKKTVEEKSEYNGITGGTPPSDEVLYSPKTDIHWDFLMKEMMWLAADFQSERKRQISKGKKVSAAVKTFFKTKETRRIRELAEVEAKRRRIAAKMARDIKSWWTKIEKIITFKQKVEADEVRKRRMDKHLVFLVKQTEKYSSKLTEKIPNSPNQEQIKPMTPPDASDSGFHCKISSPSRITRSKTNELNYPATIYSTVDIEKALNNTNDDVIQNHNHVSLESCCSSRRKKKNASSGMKNSPYGDEVDKYTLKTNEISKQNVNCDQISDEQSASVSTKRVTFALHVQNSQMKADLPLSESTSDDNPKKSSRIRKRKATINGKSSDNVPRKDSTNNCKINLPITEFLIKDNKDNDGELSDGSAEFDDDTAEDDETTLEVEERLGRDMSYQAELDLLKREADMPVEELRKMYCAGPTPPLLIPPTELLQTPNDKELFKPSSNGIEPMYKSKRRRVSRNCNIENENHPVNAYFHKHPGSGGTEGDQSQDSEYCIDHESTQIDDETTIEIEEKLGGEMSPKEEIALLKKENEIPIEDLKSMYSNMERAFYDAVTDDNSIRLNKKELNTTKAVDGYELGKTFNNSCHDRNENKEQEPHSKSSSKEEKNINSKANGEKEYLRLEEGGTKKNTLAEKTGDTFDKIKLPKKSKRRDGENNSKALIADDDYHDEFHPENEGVDDETTLEAEEKLGREMSYDEEINLLKLESEMSIDDLRAMYLRHESKDSGGGENEDKSNFESKMPTNDVRPSYASIAEDHDDCDGKDEFHPDADEGIDDETTLEAEEKLGRDISYDEEINMLKLESEIPIEALRNQYVKTEETISAVGSDSSIITINQSDFDEPNRKTQHRNRFNPTSKSQKHNEERSVTASREGLHDRFRRNAVSRPFLLSSWLKLREYQQIGLNWLVSMQSQRLNGILADEMGLGKTLQTISLLSYLASYKGIWGPHLIIVPTSCIVNWEVELKRFCPALKVLCYHGSAKRRKELRQGWTKTNWHHVVVTSYQLAVQDAFAFKRKRWYYLVLDEAQNIKNFQSQRWQTLVTFNTQRRLLLTGTPLQNNLMELWSLLHFLMPHIFKSRKEFSYWFSNPVSSLIEGNATRNDDLINRLHGIIRPFVLRRLKKDVETQMPGKFEHIVRCQLSRRQMFLYEEFMSRSSTRQVLKKGGQFMGMMSVLMQLRKVCNHPDLFEPRSVITPFSMEPISMTVAGCIVNITKTLLSFDRLSLHLLHPLWTVNGAIPSLYESVRYNCVVFEQVSRLAISTQLELKQDEKKIDESKPCDDIKPELLEVLTSIWKKSNNEKREKIDRDIAINRLRCDTQPFPYSDDLLRAVHVDLSPLEQNEDEVTTPFSIARTPKELLEMRKSQDDRARDLDDIISKFVFCVPKAGAGKPTLYSSDLRSSVQNESVLSSELMKPIETCLKSSRKTSARLSSFFPDKKLVQFDAGKLQELASLLRSLKKDDHRCLIFTQMSKMLNILEAFLNLNGHTYVRLDGGTSVEARQRLMDRFNNDVKIFCFILSTRSGGLGINLTGADTVIFYDSDWNPAMDAQAQDRAHRIGQTRDVHIYRLVTQHTIEENILIKANQKRQLDSIVMNEGKFNAGKIVLKEDQDSEGPCSDNTGANGVFTKGGLRDIIGFVDNEDEASIDALTPKKKDGVSDKSIENDNLLMSTEQMENAMATLEDEEDASAMRGARKEAAEELKEFDENVQFQKENDADNDSTSRCDDSFEDDNSNQSSLLEKRSKNESTTSNNSIANIKISNRGEKDDAESGSAILDNDAELEKEFAAWQKKVGIDISNIVSSLKPTEQYGLKFREEVDPFISVHYITEEEKNTEDDTIAQEEWDINQIEDTQAQEELRAIEEGDLLATAPPPVLLIGLRQIYLKEKASIRAQKKRRTLTGENWSTKIDGKTQLPFWYNEDTGEAIWDKPTVLAELEAYSIAYEKKWNYMPLKPLVYLMHFLLPYPDRICCASVCRQWRAAATDISFVKHVYPVEMGALNMDSKNLDQWHYNSIDDAVKEAVPGDTIELGDGHYWIHSPGLSVDFPLRIIGDENNPSHVVLELSGSIVWNGCRGWIEGVTIRRPKMASGITSGFELLRLEGKGRVDLSNCVIDNEGGDGNGTVMKGYGLKGRWNDVLVTGAPECGVMVQDESVIHMEMCHLLDNLKDGLVCCGSSVTQLVDCEIRGNKAFGISLRDSSKCLYIKKDDRKAKPRGKVGVNELGWTNQDPGAKFLTRRSELSGKELLCELSSTDVTFENTERSDT